jgi:riboflavin kinase/FMN adenylyltransferase
MRLVHGSAGFDGRERRPAVALGNFDGVHLGHQQILACVKADAARRGAPSVLYTHDPHPAVVLRHGTPPPKITTLEEKIEIVDSLGLDYMVVEPFTIDFAAQTAEAFVKDVLVGRLGIGHAFVGDNFGFGKGRAGKTGDLQRFGDALGFATTVVPAVNVDGVAVSSTRVRAAVAAGDVVLAQRFLGRPFGLRGTVVHGAARGAGLGFPTANLAPDKDLLPGRGVYACIARFDRTPIGAVVNVGVKPTFGTESLTVEAFLLDFHEDVYGRSLALEFLAKLRDEQRFPGIEALKAQIANDVASARGLLAAPMADALAATVKGGRGS